MSLRVGELFAGYGGLGMGLSMVVDAEPVWFVEFDKHPSAVLARRWPGVPNHGDITTVDWDAVEPVDILTGGFPCQDVSHAGMRAGIRPGTRSGLWEHFAYAISILKPRLVVVENVSGILSADAHCDVEPCPWCVGDEPDGHLRALGAVLADLAEAGFDAEWCSVRASDAGAPHRRERVFIVAADAGGETVGQRPGLRTGEPGGIGRGRPDNCGAQAPDRLMPTPVARDSKGRMLNSRQGGDSLPDAALNLLPTPVVSDMGRGKTPQDWDDWTQAMREKHGNGNGHGKSLEIEAQRLLPTPKASDGPNGGPGMRNGRGVADALPGVVAQLLPTPSARDWKDGSTNPDAVPVNGLLGRAVWHIEPTEGDSDAASVCEARPGEVLPGLRGADVPEAVRAISDLGGHDEVPESQDVRPVMRQHQADGEEGHAALAGAEAPEAELRDVRDDERPSRSPHRPRPGEQRPDQPDDAVLVMSPETALAGGSRQANAGRSQGYCDGCSRWGPYAAAIHRWEIRLGRLAPPPTEPGKDGRHRLSPRAVEFMMGLPDGWVCDTGIPRNAQLKALGNGVVPQQAALALSLLLPRLAEDIA